MKMSDVRDEAFTALPTPIPTKIVPDWDALYQILLERGFLVIESTNFRLSASGAEDCVPVKDFNNHVRMTKKQGLYTKRISKTRWYCTL